LKSDGYLNDGGRLEDLKELQDLCKDEAEYNGKISNLMKLILAQPNIKGTWINCTPEDEAHFKQVVNDIFSKMLFD
jgi:hypothetical protein